MKRKVVWMVLEKFSVRGMADELTEAWRPRDVEVVGEFILRMAKFHGAYHWHKHNQEELFLVYRGTIEVQTKVGNVILEEGEGVKVPPGLEHRSVSPAPSMVLMFESRELKSGGD